MPWVEEALDSIEFITGPPDRCAGPGPWGSGVVGLTPAAASTAQLLLNRRPLNRRARLPPAPALHCRSKWGAVRAAMGHPEPWALNSMAIGNEVCFLGVIWGGSGGSAAAPSTHRLAAAAVPQDCGKWMYTNNYRKGAACKPCTHQPPATHSAAGHAALPPAARPPLCSGLLRRHPRPLPPHAPHLQLRHGAGGCVCGGGAAVGLRAAALTWRALTWRFAS